jgi:hypothetical protein
MINCNFTTGYIIVELNPLKFQCEIERNALRKNANFINLESSFERTTVGRAIAQAVSRWLPTAAARIRTRVWQVGFVVDKVALGQVFSEYFGLLCQSFFHQILHHHNHPGQVR